MEREENLSYSSNEGNGGKDDTMILTRYNRLQQYENKYNDYENIRRVKYSATVTMIER